MRAITRAYDLVIKESDALTFAQGKQGELRAAASVYSESGMTRFAVELLIDKVWVFPRGKVEVVWKIAL